MNDKEDLKILKRIRSNAKATFIRKIKLFKESRDLGEENEVLNSVRDEVCACFADVEKM